jgi:hypothetical protein
MQPGSQAGSGATPPPPPPRFLFHPLFPPLFGFLHCLHGHFCRCFRPIDCCTSYTFSWTETSAQSTRLGSYGATGVMSNGRPVWQHENGQYLFWSDASQPIWYIGPDYLSTSSGVRIRSDAACPPSSAYDIYTSGAWYSTFDVAATCSGRPPFLHSQYLTLSFPPSTHIQFFLTLERHLPFGIFYLKKCSGGYALVSSGTCQSNSRYEIAQAVCETAATSLGLADTSAFVGSNSAYATRPPGCIYDGGSNLRFNTLDTSLDCGSDSHNCLCGALFGGAHHAAVCDVCESLVSTRYQPICAHFAFSHSFSIY